MYTYNQYSEYCIAKLSLNRGQGRNGRGKQRERTVSVPAPFALWKSKKRVGVYFQSGPKNLFLLLFFHNSMIRSSSSLFLTSPK